MQSRLDNITALENKCEYLRHTNIANDLIKQYFLFFAQIMFLEFVIRVIVTQFYSTVYFHSCIEHVAFVTKGRL